MFIFISFIKFGKFSAVIPSKILSAPFFFFFPEKLRMCMLVSLMVSHNALGSVHFSSILVFLCYSNLLISSVMFSSSLILSYACSKLPLNPFSEFFIIVTTRISFLVSFYITFYVISVITPFYK